MEKHAIKVSVHKIVAVYPGKIVQPISSSELKGIFSGIRSLRLMLNEHGNSRYSNPGSSDERALVFLDETNNEWQSPSNVEVAIFVHRRGENRPYEEDGSGNLTELVLAGENHQIAEVAALAIDTETSAVYWTFNQFVGGLQRLQSYLTEKYHQSLDANLAIVDLTRHGQRPQLALHTVLYPESKQDFENRMARIHSLEFQIAGDPNSLAEGFLDRPSDNQGIKFVRRMFRNSNCARLHFTLTAKRQSKKPRQSSNNGIDREFVLGLLESTKPYLEANEGSRFNVKGVMLDEEVKVLDLLNSRLTYPLKIEYNETEPKFVQIAKAVAILSVANRKEVLRYIGGNQ